MHARSAVVDLFGDHLRDHGWWAPVSGIVALAASCDVQPAATRTAVSRLVHEGWLVAEPREGTRGYAATPVAVERLDRAHRRVYAPGPPPWDGTWHVVVVDHGGDRRRRDQVGASLGYLGYGRLAVSSWLSPWPSPELSSVLRGHGATWVGVTGPPDPSLDATGLAARVWDLDGLGDDYARFASSLPGSSGPDVSTSLDAYRLRAQVVHEWRKFLFRDPGLPAQVLPDGWPGTEARLRFLSLADSLRPAAAGWVAEAVGAAAGHASPAPD
ncbi:MULTISPECIES: PaaX family transcriptional regulator C-terminal domain-containing protein [unclassified Ornithinimicrobium]|uniref:PaaX family transcriptional regulator n=1 Tax=unclassified Ornithinimicrobium TaxID=2615080 RepID=UPI0038524614